MIEIIFKIYIFIFGIMIGSFINVVIYRLPKNLSIVRPRSTCVHCHHLIPWYYNFPILSFVYLNGKCKYCLKKISYSYPLIELFFGLLALIIFPSSLDLEKIVTSIFLFSVFSIFFAMTVIDLKHYIIPDILNIYLAIMMLFYGLVFHSWQSVAWGGFVGLLIPLSVASLFYYLKGKIGLGGGDIKLYAALGLFLGPQGIIQNIFYSCFLGSLFMITLIIFKIIKSDKPIPFGPFIIFIATIQLIFPDFLYQLFF